MQFDADILVDAPVLVGVVVRVDQGLLGLLLIALCDQFPCLLLHQPDGGISLVHVALDLLFIGGDAVFGNVPAFQGLFVEFHRSLLSGLSHSQPSSHYLVATFLQIRASPNPPCRGFGTPVV